MYFLLLIINLFASKNGLKLVWKDMLIKMTHLHLPLEFKARILKKGVTLFHE